MEENNFSNEQDSFEDIVSDTAKEDVMNSAEFFDLYSDTKKEKEGKHLAKKATFKTWWKKLKMWQKTAVVTMLCLLIIAGSFGAVMLTVFNYNYNSITDDPNDLGFEQVLDKKIKNIALFGIDTRNRNSFKGLSDSIMILSLNENTKKVKIISVMRDTLVPIEHNGKKSYTKINSAYSKGGPELAIKTLNTIFGLDISEYATVNFFGMADIIEAVGGIDAELTGGEITGTNNINFCIDEICNELGINPSEYYIKSSGKHHLNGIQAVAYSRIRYVANIWGTNNDYGRTDRQRYVMEQLFNKAVTLGKSQYMSLAKALIPCAETSLSYTDIMGLATSILLHSPSFEQTRVPFTEYQMASKSVPGAGSCVYYDLDYAGKIIRSFIYDNITPEDYIKENGIEKNDWYKGSVASSTTSSSTPQSGSSEQANDYQSENSYIEPDSNVETEETPVDDTQTETTDPTVMDESTVEDGSSDEVTVVPDNSGTEDVEGDEGTETSYNSGATEEVSE